MASGVRERFRKTKKLFELAAGGTSKELRMKRKESGKMYTKEDIKKNKGEVNNYR